ncbi:MAG: CPBP family glutamic-type intramembrane protease [Thermoleophilia bacterium]|nr:CPBP family glutamic-type intramembrane protease [Thermoleophilia bacterium]MDH3725112.1 CPBP family glutamic-type intramembrane protease [Thermoleophilia bacterium]
MTTTSLPPSSPARRRLIPDLIGYLRTPTPAVPPDPQPSLTWAKLVALQFLALLVSAPFLAVGASLIEGEEFVGDEGLSPPVVLILAVVLAPLTEELAFRLPLTSFRGLYLVVSGVVLGALFPWLLPLPLLVVFLGIAFVLIVLGVGAMASARASDRIAELWRGSFRWLFYGSAVMFGLIHLGNYSFSESGLVTIVAAPLLILPQALGGVVLGYNRARLGILWSMAQHAAYNAPLGLVLLAASGSY